MSALTFSPARLQGKICAPASKSHAHRLLVAAALSDAPCLIRNAGDSGDIRTTAACLSSLGACIRTEGTGLLIEPIRSAPQTAVLDCGESASALRFFAPLASVLCENVRLTGSESLRRRPVSELLCAMRENGTENSAEQVPLFLSGRLHSGLFRIPGNISSQYISGLLFALPLLEGESRILLTTPLSSSGYVEMTLQVLQQSGIRIQREPDGFTVPGGQRYHAPSVMTAEGDWSGAAFFLAAGALGGPVTVTGLDPLSAQKDRSITGLLSRFGADVCLTADGYTVSGGPLHSVTADADSFPDLVPVLAALAACADGTSVFTGCGRLRLKETDRLDTVCQTLQAFGIRASAEKDTLFITGGAVRAASCESCHDHRIAMLASLLASKADGMSVLSDPFCVQKSYPGFYDDYLSLGGISNDI